MRARGFVLTFYAQPLPCTLCKVPDYKMSSVGIVLVSVRAIFSAELFGSAGINAYAQICNLLVPRA